MIRIIILCLLALAFSCNNLHDTNENQEAYQAGGQDELDNSIFFLKDAPLDLVDWQIDNGRRETLRRKEILFTGCYPIGWGGILN